MREESDFEKELEKLIFELSDKVSQTKREELKQKVREYNQRPEVKQRRKEYQNKPEVWEAAQKKKLLNKNTHDICRLVGTPFRKHSRNKLRCTYCSVAYTDKDLKENYFVRKYRCPCCKKTLKTFRSRQRDKPRV